MVLPVITALGLAAEFAPGLVRLLAGDKAGDVADKVAGVARVVTGQDDLDAATRALRENPELALEFRRQAADLELDLERAYLADRQSARSRDIALRQAGYKNRRADWMIGVAGLILIACLAALIWMRSDLPGEAVGIISTIAGIAGACLKDAFQFEFGSSRGSKDKDGLLSRLGAGGPAEPITWK